MKKRTRTLRGEFLSKAATISLVAVSLAGCSSAVERFGTPSSEYTGNTQNQREIIGNAQHQPSYDDIVNGPGGTVGGLPSSSSAPVSTGSVSKRSSIQSAPLPAPTSVAPAHDRATVATLPAPEVAGSSKAASWKGWSAAGGTRVTARQGDTLNTVARRYGVPVQALAAANGIDDPSAVLSGQTLIIPTYVYSSNNGYSSASDKMTSGTRPIVTGSVPAQSDGAPHPDRKPVEQPSFAQVSQGSADVGRVRLASVSTLPRKKPGIAPAPLTTASIAKPAVSSAPAMTKPAASEPALVSSAPAAAKSQPEITRTDEARPTEPIQPPVVVANVQKDTDTTTEKFRWPVRGHIISEFGAKPGGGRNEGVNLAVPEGTPVKAADDGTVIYSGNELKGYGNLILLRHSDGWVTAYAHNSELKVKRGDKVSRGDVISLAGATGSVSQPQVHFELRQGNKPVDPVKYLPQS